MSKESLIHKLDPNKGLEIYAHADFQVAAIALIPKTLH